MRHIVGTRNATLVSLPLAGLEIQLRVPLGSGIRSSRTHSRRGAQQLYQPMNAVVERLMMLLRALIRHSCAPPRALSISPRCAMHDALGNTRRPRGQARLQRSHPQRWASVSKSISQRSRSRWESAGQSPPRACSGRRDGRGRAHSPGNQWNLAVSQLRSQLVERRIVNEDTGRQTLGRPPEGAAGDSLR